MLGVRARAHGPSSGPSATSAGEASLCAAPHQSGRGVGIEGAPPPHRAVVRRIVAAPQRGSAPAHWPCPSRPTIGPAARDGTSGSLEAARRARRPVGGGARPTSPLGCEACGVCSLDLRRASRVRRVQSASSRYLRPFGRLWCWAGLPVISGARRDWGTRRANGAARVVCSGSVASGWDASVEVCASQTAVASRARSARGCGGVEHVYRG